MTLQKQFKLFQESDKLFVYEMVTLRFIYAVLETCRLIHAEMSIA